MTPIFGKGKFWGEIGQSSLLIYPKKWPPFLMSEIFIENEMAKERLVFTDTMWVKKFVKFALSGMVFEIQAFLCFAIFAKNSKIQNGCHFWWERNLFENWVTYSAELPYLSNFLSKLLYLARVSRYKYFCVLHFCKKFKMAAISLASEIFIETWKG